MRTSLRRDLTAAMKARDRTAVAALRSALAAIDNAESVAGAQPSQGGATSEHFAGATAGSGAAEVERRQLTDADLRAILDREVRERVAAADEYDLLGRQDIAEGLRSEADVLRRHLDPA
jgi:uncharacterized protein YqeY